MDTHNSLTYVDYDDVNDRVNVPVRFVQLAKKITEQFGGRIFIHQHAIHIQLPKKKKFSCPLTEGLGFYIWIERNGDDTVLVDLFMARDVYDISAESVGTFECRDTDIEGALENLGRVLCS